MDLRRLVLIGSLLLISSAAIAQAQDTLSDSAWNADRARRAALRQKAMTRVDTVTKLVDTIVVRPVVIDLRVGDSVSAQVFFSQIKATGLTLRGDTIRAFAMTTSITRSSALEIRDGMIYARAAGTAEVRVATGRRLGPDDVTRPISRIPIVVH